MISGHLRPEVWEQSHVTPREGFSFPSWQVLTRIVEAPLSLLVTLRLRFHPGQALEVLAGFLQRKVLLFFVSADGLSARHTGQGDSGKASGKERRFTFH